MRRHSTSNAGCKVNVRSVHFVLLVCLVMMSVSYTEDDSDECFDADSNAKRRLQEMSASLLPYQGPSGGVCSTLNPDGIQMTSPDLSAIESVLSELPLTDLDNSTVCGKSPCQDISNYINNF